MKHDYLSIPLVCLSLLFPTHVLSKGDPINGADVYGTCVACHGKNAEGMLATNSPKLTGMRDSYLIAQIQKFRSGLRGANPEDVYGAQMAAMAKNLPDEEAILNVVAYIGTLKASRIPRTENDGDAAKGEILIFRTRVFGLPRPQRGRYKRHR